MKFVNKTTGTILESNNEFIVNSLKENPNFKEYKEPKPKKK